MMNISIVASILCLSALSCISLVSASSFNEPHAHAGKVPPFSPGDPKVKLDSKALKVLSSGKPYQTQTKSGTSGRGIVVQDIDAPINFIWDRILDFDNYHRMVPKTIESKNYNVEKVKPTKRNPLSQIIYTRMKVGFPVLKLEFFIKHLYYPDLNSLTWTLDYTKTSDFDDSCGYWYAVPLSEEKTRIFYSVEVSMFDWVPKFVVDFMSSKALTDATAWVKKYSEEYYDKSPQKAEFQAKSGSPTDVVVKEKKFLGLFSALKRKSKAAKSKGAEQAKKDLEVEPDKDSNLTDQNVLEVTWTRLFMVSLVSILATYNIHLWLSQ